jgi:Polysaccharide deacetylase
MNIKHALKSLASRFFAASGNPQESQQFARFDTYAQAARRAGINQLYLFLSFDCDTDLDADAVGEVHQFLTSRGIKATYAVPGGQLEKAPDVYRNLADQGAEFMNHGGLPHAEWREDRWVGITFYNTMADEDVIADIHRGHNIVTTVTGQPPLGFRAPHFGCYQQPEQRDLMHRTAASLGYKYCSTTLPSMGLSNGPAYLTHGLIEFPCFGSIRYPETILDSWTYLTDRVNYSLGDEYEVLFEETVTTMLDQRIPGVLTWYADPCHILDQPPFIRAIELISKKGVASVSGVELLSLVVPN